MRKTLAEIAKAIGGRVIGDDTIVITGVSGVKEAKEGDLTFLDNPKYLPLAISTPASGIIVANNVTVEGKSVIQIDNPSLAFVQVVGIFKEDLSPKVKGVHPSAVLADDVELGDDVGIGPHVVIESGAKIGKGTVICAGVFVGQRTTLGEKCLIYPNVTIREEVSIGDRVIIHSGSVVGSDGFGYFPMGEQHMKIPQTGVVVVEDDVEIGACVTIDRARCDRTVIGRGTKIDNLVQIAHNVQTGQNCLIIAQVGIAGSTVIGNSVILAGQVGVVGHLTIGDRAVVAAQSGITKSIPPDTKMFGSPADEYRETIRMYTHLKRLPGYVKIIEELQARIKSLEEKLEK